VTTAAPLPLRLSAVSVRYGDRVALQGVDLMVRPGELVALAGPNGSGKTTLLRAALGLLAPSEGTLELFGEPLAALSIRERARRVAWMPQEELPREDVRLSEYVLYGRHAHLGPWETESREDRKVSSEAIETVGLSDRAGEGILGLSGGERQRALLARALAQQAPLLLLDEPTAHLDIAHQLDLLERIRALTRQRGTAVLAALHDLNLAGRYADRIVVLSRGRRYADGAPAEVLSEALLAEVWGVVADLRRDPRSGAPYLLPHGVLSPTAIPKAARGAGPVHVVGGGGAAAPYLRALLDAGYRVSAGVLHLLDSDAELAEELHVSTAFEVPFAAIGPEARARHRALLEVAKIVVVAPMAVGPSNVSNLEDVLAGWPRDRPLILGARSGRWDFTGGRAEAIWKELEARAAFTVDGPAALLEVLARRLPGVAPPPSPPPS
jgi:iron complex transport system ATP-binding protein